MTETPNVAVAIAGAAAEISAVPKDKTSQGAGSFNFRSIDGVMNALHGPLSKHGVSIIPDVVDYVCEGTAGSRRLHTIKVRYRIYGPAGDHVDAVVIGQGIDSQDKGYGMAMSYAFKTMASQVFTLPTDDPAMDNEHGGGQWPREPAPVDPRVALVRQVAELDEFLRGVFEYKIDDRGWATIADIPADKIGAAIATVATLAADSQITAAQLKKLGVLGTKMEASGLIPEGMEAYIFGITNSRTGTRKNLLKSEAGRIIDDWTVALADLPPA